MVKIRRLTTRMAPGVFWRPGQIDEVTEDEARKAIAAGNAVLVEGDLGPVLETAGRGTYQTASMFGPGGGVPRLRGAS